MQHFGFLFAAYSIVWIALFVYVRSLANRNREIEQELTDLRAMLEKSRPGNSPIDEPR